MKSEETRKIPKKVIYGSNAFDEMIHRLKTYTSRSFPIFFFDPAGKGKKIAADIIAAELGLGLYSADLSFAINKYIGETEKNLDNIFREASLKNAILYFEEADALFGQRHEVKDGHDRYANMEVKYLLMKIEEYNGIVILATHHGRDIDEAFIRNMRYVVDFSPVAKE